MVVVFVGVLAGGVDVVAGNDLNASVEQAATQAASAAEEINGDDRFSDS